MLVRLLLELLVVGKALLGFILMSRGSMGQSPPSTLGTPLPVLPILAHLFRGFTRLGANLQPAPVFVILLSFALVPTTTTFGFVGTLK